MASSRTSVALVPVGSYAGRPAIRVRRGITLVGGAEGAHVRLVSRSVEAMHGMIILSGGRVWVRDLASGGGVRVNGEVVREAELVADDVLGVGSFEFRVIVPAEGEGVPEARGAFTVDGNGVGMEGRVLLVGRRSGCDVVLADPKASRVHAAVVAVGGTMVVRDLGSRAGTLVNGERVHERELADGDEIQVASHVISFSGEPVVAGSEGGDLVGLEDSMTAEALGGLAAAARADEGAIEEDTPVPVEEGREEEAAIPLEMEGEERIPLEIETPLKVEEREEAVSAEVEEPLQMEALPLEVEEPVASAEPPEQTPGVEVETPVAEMGEAPVAGDDVGEEAAADEAVLGEEMAAEVLGLISDEEVGGPVKLDMRELEEAGEIAVKGEAVGEEEGRETPGIEHRTPVAEVAEAREDVAELADVEETPGGEVAAELAAAEEPAAPAMDEVVAELPAEMEEERVPAVWDDSNVGGPVTLEVAQDQDVLVPLAEARASEEEAGIGRPVEVSESDVLPAMEEVVGRAMPGGRGADDLVAAGHDEDAGGPLTLEVEEEVVGTTERAGGEADVEVAGAEEGHGAVGFGVGANQVMYLSGGPAMGENLGLRAMPAGGAHVEVSFAGLGGVVEGVERIENEAADERGEMTVPLVEEPERVGEGFGAMEEGTPSDQRPATGVEAGDERRTPNIEHRTSNAEVGEGKKEQLLGFIKVGEAGEVETSGRAGTAAGPVGLGAVVPPPPAPAVRGLTRGLTSMTGGARGGRRGVGLDVFSQLPVVTEDPVLGQVSVKVEPPVMDPGVGEGPAVAAPGAREGLASRREVEAALRIGQGAAVPPPPGQQAGEGHREKGASGFKKKFKRLFGDGGRPLSIAGVMVAVGVLVYVLAPGESVVRGEIVYRNLDAAPDAVRRAVTERQRVLLSDPAVLTKAAQEVIGMGLAPGFLGDPIEASRRLDREGLWPEGRGDVMAISFATREPREDSERVRALVRAVVESPANKNAASAGEAARGRVEQARGELAVIEKNIAELERRVAEGARTAGAREGAGGAREGEPAGEEKAWRDASLATLRARSEVDALEEAGVGAADERMKQAMAVLAATGEKEQAARQAFEQSAAAGGAAGVGDPRRRAAEAGVSLRVLRQRHADKERELAREREALQGAVVPEAGGGVWVDRPGNNRGLYALLAAVGSGAAMSYLGGTKTGTRIFTNRRHESSRT